MTNVYVRLALYILSTLLGLLPASVAGWVAYDPETHILTLNLQAALAAIAVGGVGSVAIFKKWGVS